MISIEITLKNDPRTSHTQFDGTHVMNATYTHCSHVIRMKFVLFIRPKRLRRVCECEWEKVNGVRQTMINSNSVSAKSSGTKCTRVTRFTSTPRSFHENVVFHWRRRFDYLFFRSYQRIFDAHSHTHPTTTHTRAAVDEWIFNIFIDFVHFF